jgi:hypothetical protein
MGDPAHKRGVVIELKPRVRRIRGHRVAFLVGRSDEGPLVDYPGNGHGPLPARTTVPLPGATGESERREVLVVFAEERSDRPVIVGLLPAATGSGASEAPGAVGVEARVDGRRVVLEALDEIVLACGEASITLRRNGRVVIRGAYVETRSRGVNRIRGGSVKIN